MAVFVPLCQNLPFFGPFFRNTEGLKQESPAIAVLHKVLKEKKKEKRKKEIERSFKT